MAASQGTMNNFTFGNGRYQYYETICGGSGAGADFDGTECKLTLIPALLIQGARMAVPVLLESFAIR